MDIHDRISFALEASNLAPNKVSLGVGKGRNWLSQTVNNKSKIDCEIIPVLAQALGVTPNYLFGFGGSVSLSSESKSDKVEAILSQVASEVQKRLMPDESAPTIEQLISWWHRQGGILGDFDQISNVVDLYHAPQQEDRFIQPYKVGSRSLAARSFSVESAEELAALLRSFPEDLNYRIVSEHQEALQGHPKLSLEKIKVPLPHLKRTATFEYTRLLLPFRDPGGNEYLLCYSRSLY